MVLRPLDPTATNCQRNLAGGQYRVRGGPGLPSNPTYLLACGQLRSGPVATRPGGPSPRTPTHPVPARWPDSPPLWVTVLVCERRRLLVGLRLSWLWQPLQKIVVAATTTTIAHLAGSASFASPNPPAPVPAPWTGSRRYSVVGSCLGSASDEGAAGRVPARTSSATWRMATRRSIEVF